MGQLLTLTMTIIDDDCEGGSLSLMDEWEEAKSTMWEPIPLKKTYRYREVQKRDRVMLGILRTTAHLRVFVGGQRWRRIREEGDDHGEEGGSGQKDTCPRYGAKGNTFGPLEIFKGTNERIMRFYDGISVTLPEGKRKWQLGCLQKIAGLQETYREDVHIE
ncbi:hypothetical protein P280DRAFT_208687 [Massarina eburnea CBS 473.64]|uniref:Uncharacterized protein n=1 Tax=Massarina eburnea CBS 473.64 TaxID=1395130 RepID=A0A6A6RIB1_9PLEO|nr:hypothetical protein P280DRAFT_208687 [Massarina eburnea CBS 473.64]